MTKFSYWYQAGYYGYPYDYRRTDGLLYEQLKNNKAWGYSDPERFHNSYQIPDTCLLLVGGAP
jgi:hypothetical protein